MANITVIKCDFDGRETWRYTGQVIARQPTYVVLEARFNREDLPFHGILLGKGDRFVETYYTDHWYNLYEIHDRRDDHVKGWYCNVGYPAEISEDVVSYRDLALDLLVYPDGRQLVLDEDEFTALPLSPEVRTQARAALAELQAIFMAKTGHPEFDWHILLSANHL